MMTIKKEFQLKNPAESFVRPIVASAILGMQLINGIIEAQSAVMLPQLTAERSSISITQSQSSWIASLGILASPVSSVLCGPLMDFLGRKIVLEGYYAIAVVGFLTIACAKQVTHLYIGRFILSIANGFGMGTIVYLPEMCSRDHGRRLAALLMPLYSAGVLAAFLVGGTVPWNKASAAYTLLSSIGLICAVLWTPESPVWLVNEGRLEDASRSLRYLRDCKLIDVEADLQVLKMSRKSIRVQRARLLSDLLEPIVWKPFLILVLFHFLQIGTGFYGLMYYTVDFFDDLRTAFDPLTVTIFLAVARLIMSCVFGTYFATRLDRKSVTALSSCLSGLSLLGAAAYEHIFKSTEVDDRLHTWIPITCILINVLISTMTLQPLPWLMTQELFPLPVRGIMSGLTYFIGTFLVFLSVKYFMTVMSFFGISGALSFFSASSFLVCLFGVFVLPETNNKSRTEIEGNFTKTGRAAGDFERVPLIGNGGVAPFDETSAIP